MGCQHMSICNVEDLYLMMGREFESREQVPAGNILGELYNPSEHK